MPSATCVRCGVVIDSLTPSGLCTVCVSQTNGPRPPDLLPSASTLTRPPTDAETRTDGPEGLLGALPPTGYRYDQILGEGGMGVVWKAERLATRQTVAIKKLLRAYYTPSGLRRFVAEARALAAVDHPNVVRLFDFIPDPADPILVMEFVPGEPLSRHLKEVGPLHPDRVARLMAAAARGVQAAHDAGIIHRDLKPSNLLLTPDGKVKVVDFGLGKQMVGVEAFAHAGAGAETDDVRGQSLTRTGHVAGGTPGFMAPEQVSGECGQVDCPTDVWGLGACLYALLTGQPPFPAGRSNLGRVLTEEFVPLRQVNPAIPVDLAAIVEKCLQKDATDRYESAGALADDLDRYLARDSTAACPKPWAERAWQRFRKTPLGTRVLVGLVALSLLSAVAALSLIPREDRSSTSTPDVLAEIKAEIAAGRQVTLTPPDGPPRWYRWLEGASDIPAGPMWHGGFQFQTSESSRLCLLDDPVVPAYRVEAELRHLVARRPHSRIGLFFGHAVQPGPNTDTALALLSWEFSDWWDDTEIADPKLKASHAAQLFDRREYQADQGKKPDFGKESFDTHFFTPFVIAGGDWRKLAVEVSPAGVTMFWWDEGKRIWIKAFFVTAADINKKRKVWADDHATHLGRPVIAPAWSPRQPLGIYASNATIAVRNFTLQTKE